MAHRPRCSKIIRDARRAADLTQIELAERLGVRQSAVSAWETGAAIPTPSMILKLVQFLELNLEELLEAFAARKEGEDDEEPALT